MSTTKPAKFEEDSNTDSGYISSGHILLSGDLAEEDTTMDKPQKVCSDSGVCLSDTFSSLTIKEHHDMQAAFAQNQDGDTQLHLAIINGHLEVVKELISLADHSSWLDLQNDYAQTPLHLAVITGQALVVRQLITAGAKANPRDLNGDSPLHLAAQKGDSTCVKSIVNPVKGAELEVLNLRYQPDYKQIDPNQWNYVGQTSVHVAAQRGHLEVLKLLVAFGVDVNAREGCMGFTALHYAVLHQNETLVHFLLGEFPHLNPHVLSYGGRSALEVVSNVPTTILNALKARGLATPYISDDELYSDEEDEITELSSQYWAPTSLVNASA